MDKIWAQKLFSTSEGSLVRFFRKNYFRQKYTNDMSIVAVFDGDYESAIIFCENMYMKNENSKV